MRSSQKVLLKIMNKLAFSYGAAVEVSCSYGGDTCIQVIGMQGGSVNLEKVDIAQTNLNKRERPTRERFRKESAVAPLEGLEGLVENNEKKVQIKLGNEIYF